MGEFVTLPTRIGKYEIDRRIGGGGMAEVYLGRLVGVESFTRLVAIKRVLPEYANDAAFAELFVAEAKLTAQLAHSNIVSVVDFDRDPEHGLFLAMEMIDGPDLNRLLHTGPGPLPFSVVIYLVTEILAGLGFAHNLPIAGHEIRGIVHRDVSPHNVLLSWHGEVKVSDFGIAKARVASNASASIMLKGKPAYMSPEQVSAKPLDGRSDLFSVGVMLWEMLVGRSLFGGCATIPEVFASVVFAEIPSPRQVRPDVPEDLAHVTMQFLQRDREQRYATAEEARSALFGCEAANGANVGELIELLKARFPGQAPQRSSQARKAAVPAAAFGKPALSPPRRGVRLGLMFVGALVVAAGATIAVLELTKGGRDVTHPPSAAAATQRSPIEAVRPAATANVNARVGESSTEGAAVSLHPASQSLPAPPFANEKPKAAESSRRPYRAPQEKQDDGRVRRIELKPAPNLLSPP